MFGVESKWIRPHYSILSFSHLISSPSLFPTFCCPPVSLLPVLLQVPMYSFSSPALKSKWSRSRYSILSFSHAISPHPSLFPTFCFSTRLSVLFPSSGSHVLIPFPCFWHTPTSVILPFPSRPFHLVYCLTLSFLASPLTVFLPQLPMFSFPSLALIHFYLWYNSPPLPVHFPCLLSHPFLLTLPSHRLPFHPYPLSYLCYHSFPLSRTPQQSPYFTTLPRIFISHSYSFLHSLPSPDLSSLASAIIPFLSLDSPHHSPSPFTFRPLPEFCISLLLFHKNIRT